MTDNPLDRQATTPRDEIANLIEASRQLQTEVAKLRTRIQEDWSITNGRYGSHERAIQGIRDLLGEFEGIKPQVEILRQKVVALEGNKKPLGRPKGALAKAKDTSASKPRLADKKTRA